MGESFHNDAVYVAVNQHVPESEKTLLWTLKYLQLKKFVLLHVHLPFSLTAPSSRLEESEIDAIQESLLNDSYDSLHKYRDICTKNGVNEEDVDISLISGHDVGERIVELIYQHNIKKLVMGAAADPHYSRGMSITSRKAEYVSQNAPNFCKMWFICKGKLIKTREWKIDLGKPSASFPALFGSDKKPSNGRRDEHETEPPKENSGHKPETEGAPEKEGQDKTNSNGSEADSSPCPPREYICPIKLEIMQDPQVAADGFSYEGEAFRNWLRKGGLTSPKTGQMLKNHTLTPNHTLRSLIKDWLYQHPNYID